MLRYKNSINYTKKKRAKPKKKKWYTQEQEKRIVELAKDLGIDGLTVFIPLKTGLRPGEVMALMPSRDISFDFKTLTVNESVKVAHGGEKVGLPKTETSQRTIPVDDEFLDHMKQFEFTGYIFDNGDGLPKNYSNWMKQYNRMMDALPKDILRYDPHEMRHTHGTLL